MTVIVDSTVLIHLSTQHNKMTAIMDEKRITTSLITRINYLELLSGGSMHSKASIRKFLQKYPVVEFDAKAAQTANKLALRYTVSAKQSKDFLIACIAVANNIPILTENSKDFKYKELKVISYKISSVG